LGVVLIVLKEQQSMPIAIGTRAEGQDNRRFVYVQANGAIAVGETVGIDEDFQAASLTTTTAAAMPALGWASDHAFAGNEFGFVTVSGTNYTGLYTTATGITAGYN
jgi:hypothetical protein